MSKNNFGVELDKNGYAPSIIQVDTSYCYLCGRRDRKLDRHEVWGASNRQKSKEDGLWVMLCHDECHLNGVHAKRNLREQLSQIAQARAMKVYGWSADDFIARYGKNWL